MYDYCIILLSFYILTLHKKLVENLMIHRMGIGIDLIFSDSESELCLKFLLNLKSESEWELM
jgi:hypothetical protein